jgi:uncharacterized RDD family membrane protein YckC
MQIHVAKDGKQSGPYSIEQVQDMVRSGLVSAADLGWYEGMGAWAPLHTLAGLGVPPPTLGGVAMGAGGPPGGRSKRLVAIVIDGVLFGTLLGAAFGFGMLTGGGFHWGIGLVTGLGLMGIAWLAFVVVQCYLLADRGQTLGKMAMGLRIVCHADGTNPGFLKAVLLRTFLWAIITAIPFVGAVLALVDALFVFRDDQRCLHDHLAGTRVVVA